MAYTPAWAKNVARRVLAAVISPEPAKKLRPSIAAFFDEECAYCGVSLSDKWHLDHLLSVDNGGSNHLSNRVPACPPCNEDEKRDMAWMEFLRLKCAEPTVFEGRFGRIESWRTEHGAAVGATIPEALRAAYLQEVAFVSKAIDESCARLKAMKATKP